MILKILNFILILSLFVIFVPMAKAATVILYNGDSYDFSTNARGYLSGGDFYFGDHTVSGKFWANNLGQRGLQDLGDIGLLPLSEVSIPSTAKYVPGADLDYYLTQAGGYTQNSDEGNEVVILPNGRKWEPGSWFFGSDPEILSGSTIIVPTIYEVDTSVWPIIRDTFTIISSIAIIILTVQSLAR